jgi:hypothetical protein
MDVPLAKKKNPKPFKAVELPEKKEISLRCTPRWRHFRQMPDRHVRNWIFMQ